MSSTPKTTKTTKSKKTELTPKQELGGGVFLLVLAVVAYFYIGHAEQTGGTFTLPIVIAWVYDLLGKWGIVGVLLAFGVLSIAMGIRDLRKQPTLPAPAAGSTETASEEQPPTA